MRAKARELKSIKQNIKNDTQVITTIKDNLAFDLVSGLVLILALTF